ncbi:MAG: lamin tail domain-containing protein [Candidatus Neomarinimicrobiota bacterium]
MIWGDNPPPSAPSQLEATDISYTTVTLTWTDNSTDESGFRVYQNDSLISITNINTTVYTVEGLTSGNSYTFGVTAWSANGESAAATLQIATLSEDTTNRVIFFSEYIEGSSNNKALEIVNGSTIAVNLDDFAIISNTNNDPWLATNYKFPSGTILNPGQVWVIAYSSADQSILGVANDVVSSTVMNFNGDDVRALVKISGTDTIFLDIIGAYRDSTYSTSGWPVAGVSGATKDHTLVRKPEIRCGNAVWATSSGTNADDSEWIVYDQNTFTYLGTHSFSDKIIVPGPSFDGPDYFQLYPAYPNPFNNTTHLAFDMPISSAVILTIFDLHGNQISEICLGPLSAGRHDFEWNGNSYVSGLYFYRVQVGEQARAGKFLLLK